MYASVGGCPVEECVRLAVVHVFVDGQEEDIAMDCL